MILKGSKEDAILLLNRDACGRVKKKVHLAELLPRLQDAEKRLLGMSKGPVSDWTDRQIRNWARNEYGHTEKYVTLPIRSRIRERCVRCCYLKKKKTLTTAATSPPPPQPTNHRLSVQCYRTPDHAREALCVRELKHLKWFRHATWNFKDLAWGQNLLNIAAQSNAAILNSGTIEWAMQRWYGNTTRTTNSELQTQWLSSLHNSIRATLLLGVGRHSIHFWTMWEAKKDCWNLKIFKFLKCSKSPTQQERFDILRTSESGQAACI